MWSWPPWSEGKPQGRVSNDAGDFVSEAEPTVQQPSASRFNVLNHMNVAFHEVLTEAQAKALLAKYHLVKEQLPKIRSNDPAARVIDAKPGQILKITRRSPTAGVAIAYRVCVEAI